MWFFILIFMAVITDKQLLDERLMYGQVARQDLITFAKITSPLPSDATNLRKSKYRAARHHHKIAEALMMVESGQIKRLNIEIPYRHGKTELGVRKFVPYVMGRSMVRKNPIDLIILTFADSLANEHGRDCREVFRSSGNRLAFGTRMREDSQAMDRLQLQADNGVKGPTAIFSGRGGIGGGFGAGGIIFDDFFKNAAEAQSLAIREAAWHCFIADCLTRLNEETGWAVIIGTRKHEDDVQGRLLDPTNQHYDPVEAAKWTTLRLPALAEENDPLGRAVDEPLWPERFGFEFWNERRSSRSEIVRIEFQTQGQCQPTPAEGNHFKKDWLLEYDAQELPKYLKIFGTSDHAVRGNQTNDLHCLLLVGIDPSDVIWILPTTWWERSDTLEMTEKWIDLIRDNKPVYWWAARDMISGSIKPFLLKRMRERQVYGVVDDELREDKDLVRRSQSIRNRMAMGMVRWPRFWPKWHLARQQLLTFPNGKNDDLVAALAILGMKLDQLQKSEGPGAPPAKKGTFEWHSWGQENREVNVKKW